MGQLYLLRQGHCKWDQEDRFTGWVDVPLSPGGEEEMTKAGEKLRRVVLDRVYSSALIQTRQSAGLMLITSDHLDVKPVAAWELNDRYYGRLQGLSKKEAEAEFGKGQINLWQSSTDTRPPGGESLEDVAARVIPYFDQVILPQVAAGRNVLVCAHAVTLRAIMMRLEWIFPNRVNELEIPPGSLFRLEMAAGGKLVNIERIETD